MIIGPHAFAYFPGAGDETEPQFAVVDSFTDADGTALVDHDPDTDVVGNGWTGSAGTVLAEIQGNELQFTSDGENAWIDSGVSDVLITVYWTPESGGRNSILARRVSDNDDRMSVNCREPNGDILILEDGSDIGSTSFAWDAATTYKLQFELIGDQIRFLVDDVEVLTATSSHNQSETRHGLRRDSGVDATRFDDFSVEDLT